MPKIIRPFIFLLILFFLPISLSKFCYTDCFSTKGCFFKPYGCTPYVNCSYAVSYQSDGEWAYLELLGRGQSEKNSYVAAAFSKDGAMGDDSVVECSSFNNGPLLGRASYNQGKTNIRMNITPSTENSFIRTLAVDYYNGMIYCRLARRVQVPRDVNRNQAFQLDDPHHILVSAGPTTIDRNGNGLLQVHSLNRASNDFPYATVQTITVNQYRIPLGSVIPVNSYQPYGQESGGFNNPSNQQPGYQQTSFTFNNSQIPLVYPGPGPVLGSNPSAQQPNQNFNGPTQTFQGPGYQNNNQGYSPDGFPMQGPSYDQGIQGTPGSSINPQSQGYLYTTPTSQQQPGQLQYDQSPPPGGYQSTPFPGMQVTTQGPFTQNPYSNNPNQGPQQSPYLPSSTPNPGFSVVPINGQQQFDQNNPQSSAQQGYSTFGPQNNGAFTTQNPNYFNGPQSTVTGPGNYQQNQNQNQQPNPNEQGFPLTTNGPGATQGYTTQFPQSTTPNNNYIAPIAAGAGAGAAAGAGFANNNQQPRPNEQGFPLTTSGNFGGSQTGAPNNQPNQNFQNNPGNNNPNQQNQGNPNQGNPQGGPSQNPQNNQQGGGQNLPGNVPQRDSFTNRGIIPGSDNPIEPQLLKAHAILMTLAWMIFISTALLFARFYRGFWPNTTVGGLFLWFHFHRTLNIIGIGATIAGFVCIFVARDWTWVGPQPGNVPGANSSWPSVHAMLGILACVVAWAQPLNAVFRCHPKSRLRWIYNIYHIFFGYSAWLMACAALMIACTHFDFMFLNRDAVFGLCIAFLAATGGVFILLEILSIFQWFKNRRATGDIEVIEPDGRTHVTLSSTTKRINICRMLILFFYLIVAIGCAVAISVLIGLRKNEDIRQTEGAYLSRTQNN